MFGFFKASPEKESRQLARDATTIIEMAEHTYKTELMQEIARTTRFGLAQMQVNCGDDEVCRARELDRYKALHRESRRNNAQASLTAYTLLIIHTRGAALGEPGAPVIAIIEEFLQRWPPEEGEQGPAPEAILPG